MKSAFVTFVNSISISIMWLEHRQRRRSLQIIIDVPSTSCSLQPQLLPLSVRLMLEEGVWVRIILRDCNFDVIVELGMR